MTSAISSFVPPVAPQMPPQAAASAPSPSSQPGFSQMLSRAQAREGEAPAAPERAPEAAGKSTHSADRAKGEKPGKAEKAAKADGEPKAEKAGEKAEKADGDTTEAEATEATDKPAADPALAEWLAALQRPAAPQDEAHGQGGAAADAEAGDATTAMKNGAARGGHSAGKDVKAQDADQVRDLKAKAEPATREAADNGSFKAAMAEAAESRRELKPVQELHTPHNTAAAGLQPAHGAARSSEAAAPTSVQVPTPATSPDFAQALGVQVSVLAKDGIQQAELHLNPAEMGPISVQIAIDGTQAQVNFGADSAATRQIIESGLPELAASLRDAGFTLSGGGVHSQARGREQGSEGGRDGERSGSRGVGGIETDVTTRRVTGRVSAGGVDLYA